MISAARVESRTLNLVTLTTDLVVVGGGLAGVCCALNAARGGIQVVLVQDRPVLGGNASSEVRLWALGATSHMGNNNRWAREGGVIDEILVENLARNPEGNPLLFDVLLLEKVTQEPNVTLLLNTAVYETAKADPHTIESVRAFCSQNSTEYSITAPLFCDASGDGILGFLSGASFRIGSEASSEFGEKFAPAAANRDLLGHTIYFYTKDTGRPVMFIPPAFALQDITQIPRWREIKAVDAGCALWWLEWGGAYDTVHETERIKWELWKVAYGFWNHIKNSGQFPQAENLTLEWIGTIPGKRESRRFEGDYMLTQQDVVEQRLHDDAVSFGGWAIDLHPVDGVYSDKPGCTQWHSAGVYQIPYRCLYSRDISNLFLGGRLISVSHIAFGSTRVMLTCAHNGQAVGTAAALCIQHQLLPRDLAFGAPLRELQRELLAAGQYIPSTPLRDSADLASTAEIKATSELALSILEANGDTQTLDQPWAMMLPVPPGPMPSVTFWLDVKEATSLQAELRISAKPGNHTPNVTLAALDLPLHAGENQPLVLDFGSVHIEQPGYVFVCLKANEHVAVRLSDQRLTGVLAVTHRVNKAVAKTSTQSPPPDSGIDTFEFWTPLRRPLGKNFALAIKPPLKAFAAAQLTNGIDRPVAQANAWVADFNDATPGVTLSWPLPQTINRVDLVFDTDFDHPMESLQMGHPERFMPFCVKSYRLLDDQGNVVAESFDNHQTRIAIRLKSALLTKSLRLECLKSQGPVPAALFAIRCYNLTD